MRFFQVLAVVCPALLFPGVAVAAPHAFSLDENEGELTFRLGDVIHAQHYGDENISYVFFSGCHVHEMNIYRPEIWITTYTLMDMEGKDFPLTATLRLGIGDSFSFFMYYFDDGRTLLATKNVEVVDIKDGGLGSCTVDLQPAL